MKTKTVIYLLLAIAAAAGIYYIWNKSEKEKTAINDAAQTITATPEFHAETMARAEANKTSYASQLQLDAKRLAKTRKSLGV